MQFKSRKNALQISIHYKTNKLISNEKYETKEFTNKTKEGK